MSINWLIFNGKKSSFFLGGFGQAKRHIEDEKFLERQVVV
jgi:hypothetical protein